MDNGNAAAHEEMMGAFMQNLQQGSDPYKKMLGQIILQNLQNGREHENHTTNGEPQNLWPAQMRRDIKTLIKMNRELTSEYKKLQREYDKLARLNEYAASALGACPCWGFDTNCVHCQGNGAPGNLMIDDRKFGRLVQPLFLKLMQTIDQTEDRENT